MQNFVKPRVFGKEMWGQSIGYLKFLDVQPHMLPNFKLHMPSFWHVFHIDFELAPKTF
jgi:hypothetical protein